MKTLEQVLAEQLEVRHGRAENWAAHIAAAIRAEAMREEWQELEDGYAAHICTRDGGCVSESRPNTRQRRYVTEWEPQAGDLQGRTWKVRKVGQFWRATRPGGSEVDHDFLDQTTALLTVERYIKWDASKKSGQ